MVTETITEAIPPTRQGKPYVHLWTKWIKSQHKYEINIMHEINYIYNKCFK